MENRPECDLDEWYHFYLGTMPGHSLIRDELVSEDQGKKNIFRRRHNGRPPSEKRVLLNLQAIASGSDYHHGEVPIRERREAFTRILVDRNASSKVIEEYVKSTILEGSPVHEEIYAALMVTAGPRSFVKAVLSDDSKYYKRILPSESSQSISTRRIRSRMDPEPWWSDEMVGQDNHRVIIANACTPILPLCVVLCNEGEAEIIVRETLAVIDREITARHKSALQNAPPELVEKLSRLHPKISIVRGPGRAGSGDSKLPMPDRLGSLGSLFLKFPGLFDIAAELGWESKASMKWFDYTTWEEREESKPPMRKGWFQYYNTWWHLSRPLVRTQ